MPTTFLDVFYGDHTLERAWELAKDLENEAFLVNDQHGPREFSATTSVQPHPTITDPLPEDEAEELIQERRSLLSPGAVEGVPVFMVRQASQRRAGELNLIVSVDPERIADNNYMTGRILQAVPEDWFQRLGRRAHSWTNAPAKLSAENILFWRKNVERASVHHVASTTEISTRDAPNQIRYVAVNLTNPQANPVPTRENSFPTVEQALASINTTLPEHSMRLVPNPVEYGVIGVAMNSEGPLLAHRTLASSESDLSLKVAIGYQTRPREVTNERGWLLYGCI